MILITGANGNLGKATIDFLLKKIKPEEIAGMVRNSVNGQKLLAKGVEIRTGDYFDYHSLVKAFNGIDKLLLISSSDLNERSRQHNRAIRAAKAAGVKHIIYTSILNPSPSSAFLATESHIDTEKFLKTSGLNYTIFRNSIYMDTIPVYIGDAFQNGKILYPFGEGKISFVARADIAEALANVLTSEDHENKIYEISGSEAYSFNDIAVTLSELTNETIQYIVLSHEVYKDELRKKLSIEQTEIIASMVEAIRYNEFSYTGNVLEKLLGRKPMGLKEFLKNTYLTTLELCNY